MGINHHLPFGGYGSTLAIFFYFQIKQKSDFFGERSKTFIQIVPF